MTDGVVWAEHFKNWAHYNEWATARLLHALEAVSDQDYRRDVGLFFKSIHGTLNHLLVGEHQLWYRRFAEGISPKIALDSEMVSDRKMLVTQLLESTRNWQPLIESWSGQRFDGVLNYTTMRGAAASLPFAMTLTHVFNHGTHHRGQITAAMTHMGYSCPELDMVYCLQKQSPIPE